MQPKRLIVSRLRNPGLQWLFQKANRLRKWSTPEFFQKMVVSRDVFPSHSAIVSYHFYAKDWKETKMEQMKARRT